MIAIRAGTTRLRLVSIVEDGYVHMTMTRAESQTLLEALAVELEYTLKPPLRLEDEK